MTIGVELYNYYFLFLQNKRNNQMNCEKSSFQNARNANKERSVGHEEKLYSSALTARPAQHNVVYLNNNCTYDK